MEISGRMIHKGEIEENNGYTKRVFAIETSGDYPKKVAFELGKKNIGAVDGFNIGSELKVSFDPSSREWNGKWYSTNYAWKVEGESAPQKSPQTVTNEGDDTGVESDDLPF